MILITANNPCETDCITTITGCALVPILDNPKPNNTEKNNTGNKSVCVKAPTIVSGMMCNKNSTVVCGACCFVVIAEASNVAALICMPLPGCSKLINTNPISKASVVITSKYK